MKTETQPVRFEEGAMSVTLEGFACKTCRRFYGTDERAAKWCCAADLPCGSEGCQGRTEKPWAKCSQCRSKSELAKWEARERREWDGKQMIHSERTDRFYSDLGEALDDMEDAEIPFEEMRFVLCEPDYGRTFVMAEYLEDSLPSEDPELQGDPREIEAAVNAWIRENGPFSWWPGKYALARQREDTTP